MSELGYVQLINSPVGALAVGASERGVRVVLFGDAPTEVSGTAAGRALAERAVAQLAEYFAGTRQVFDLLMDWEALPPFQRQVLQATAAIPFGQVRTYAQIAAQIGRPRAARAVGNAEAHNPMPILLPCHRVVGSDRRMHGYGGPGGIARKVALLKLDGHRFEAERLND